MGYKAAHYLPSNADMTELMYSAQQSMLELYHFKKFFDMEDGNEKLESSKACYNRINIEVF